MRYAFALLALALSASSCAAANIWAGKTEDGSQFIAIDGPLVVGDDKTFNNLAIAMDRGMVVMNSPGGVADVGMGIGRTISIKGFGTTILGGYSCASACGLAWLAGRPRTLFEDAHVGFHAIFTIENGANNVSSDGNALVGSYLRGLGFSDAVIQYATFKRPDSMQWLSKEDASVIGLDVTFIPRSPTVEAVPKSESAAVTSTTTTTIPIPESADRVEMSDLFTKVEPQQSVPAVTWGFVDNTDLMGFDLPNMPLKVISAADCYTECSKAPKCTAYTFNAEARACFLKFGASQALQFSGAYSGFKSTNIISRIGREHGADVGFRTNFGSEIVAVPYSTYLNKTLAWCQDDCIDDFQCKSFTYFRNGACVKFHVKKPTRLNPEVYSGVKTE